MDTEIESVIKRLFPKHLCSRAAFEDWSDSIRQDVLPSAADLVARLKRQLALTKVECRTASGFFRDCWELFGGELENTIKSSASIRSKLARDLMDEKITASPETEASLRTKILKFSDLGRVRIVADFPSDIATLLAKLLKGDQFLEQYACPKGIKDFVFDPSRRDGLKGHRAHQFSVRVPIDDVDNAETFGFEVQMMTRLQHAWDRRNHPLYEWQRERPDWTQNQEAVELAINDLACAEALHLVDRQADQNWQCLQEFIRKETPQ